jgi:hypothetical protein
VNIQFVDRNGQLIQLLLDLVDVDSEESKTGAYLATLLIQTIKDYNLATRLGWITSDNVGVNDTLVRAIKSFIRAEGINYWTEKTRRLRCISHIINLATQAFMFAVEDCRTRASRPPQTHCRYKAVDGPSSRYAAQSILSHPISSFATKEEAAELAYERARIS